jgi:type 1 glutamine amidotransferase
MRLKIVLPALLSLALLTGCAQLPASKPAPPQARKTPFPEVIFDGVAGFKDTPMQPGGLWHVHDPGRPQPPIVTPGSFSELATPPSDAVVLFDGRDLSQWQSVKGGPAPWTIVDGAMVSRQTDIVSTREFGDLQLHVEFCEPLPATGSGQGRGNSGVFLMGKYEVQVLDCFNNKTYADGATAGLYGQHPPLVNACRPPGQWQTYDITFTVPHFAADGTLVAPGYVTVIQNGVVVQNHQAFRGPTNWRVPGKYIPHGPTGPIGLQYHNNAVRFRNIWVRALAAPDGPPDDWRIQTLAPSAPAKSLGSPVGSPRANELRLLAGRPMKQPAATPKKLLVVSTTAGFRHSSIPTAERILAQLARESGAFTVDFVRQPPGQPAPLKKDASDDQKAAFQAAQDRWNDSLKTVLQKLSPESLANYDGVVFLSTTGDLPIPDREGFLHWINEGHAFIGLHAATDTFHNWPGFIDMLGGEFEHHGRQVSVECLNQDPHHPATAFLGKSWTISQEEIYQFKNYDPSRVHDLLILDKHPETGAPGHFGVAWCKNYGQGRVFYTSLGHREDIWNPDPNLKDRKNSPAVSQAYQRHVLGGIKWALGLAP